MGGLFSYSILSAIALIACYLPYRLWMSGRKQLSLNRTTVCLLYTLALLSPFLIISTGGSSEFGGGMIYQATAESGVRIPESIANMKRWDLESILVLIYTVGVIFGSLIYLSGLIKLMRIVRGSRRERCDAHIVRVTDNGN